MVFFIGYWIDLKLLYGFLWLFVCCSVLFVFFAFFAVSVCFRRFSVLLSPFCFFGRSGLLFSWSGSGLVFSLHARFVCVPVCCLVPFLLFSLFSLYCFYFLFDLVRRLFFCFVW